MAHRCATRHATDLAPFVSRHLGTAGPDMAAVLHRLGIQDPPEPADAGGAEEEGLEQLAAAVLPAGLAALERPAHTHPADVGSGGLSEAEAVEALRGLAALNDPHTEMIGQGYHPTRTPAVIARDILGNPAWTTAYTPYQAEISQGRLEAQLLFQTTISDLTALPVACTSLLDEATAVAEAAMLMARASRRTEGTVVLDAGLHPQCLQVAQARCRALGLDCAVTDVEQIVEAGLLDRLDAPPLLGAVLAHTTTRGSIQDLATAVEAVHDRGGLVAIDADPLALTLLSAPGQIGADIAVGSAQRLGVPLLFGGPHPGYMAVSQRLQRQLPGRIVGVSRDAEGAPAYRLALQTREQHIRRERATSNICTAQALLAVVAAMYAVHHGPEGLRAIAERIHARAAQIALGLRRAGLELEHEDFFDTLSIRLPGRAAQVLERAAAGGYNLRLLDADHLGLSTNETTTGRHVEELIALLTGRDRAEAGQAQGRAAGAASDEDGAAEALPLPAGLRRSGDYLTHPSFHLYRSEAALVRYLRRLADRDLALDRTMIPLGSCTLKLNAAVESALWLEPALAGIHPCAPADQTRGWRLLLAQLSERLVGLVGYDRISLQPASGAQGELTGLLAIAGYLESIGQGQRDTCLVPASAHGTNAASAAGAGMRVVVVATAADGSIDVDDLRATLEANEGRVAAIMLTYPSTHGVFEPQVSQVAQMVHDAGGQVYIDGANLNAMCGLLRPGDLGGDVSHLNLHKTFAIPHGGGGPGVGPVAVKEHLAPFLPAGPRGSAPAEPGDPDAGFQGAPAAGARFGSAGVMPLAWSYLALMDDADLRRASLSAIAHANYISRELEDCFPTLYTGPGGWVAHECILDLRELTAATGVSAEDVAKRLIDYGFHAPTLAFPVAGTLMVEPTESEPKAEIDRFIAAMRAIRAEIDQVGSGRVALEDSVLRRSPHTLAQVAADEWERPYPRSQAAFPLAGMERDKYFAPVARIDNAYGDRNLACTCPPPEAFDDGARTDDGAHT
ncbi:aminomethyl-transferring glycine dehydrogenase [Actinomyces capricornis]|uniref:glycine dehydrogenase (aminomethyl-transferring) n=1 Tax=Actinomyces capricornis TaxID=2755559 RepID=A0ABM7UDG1_9ACTO|nr:aminomethyl-transferring glycine dehydrogenase [Actinomyces capricornis]BDA65189.1 glycine dehydrogenase (decarboxylating) [Actinomyces capricornis]